MAGPIHCRTVLEGSWEQSREAQFEAQTRFRAVAGPKGRTPSLQRREKRGCGLREQRPGSSGGHGTRSQAEQGARWSHDMYLLLHRASSTRPGDCYRGDEGRRSINGSPNAAAAISGTRCHSRLYRDHDAYSAGIFIIWQPKINHPNACCSVRRAKTWNTSHIEETSSCFAGDEITSVGCWAIAGHRRRGSCHPLAAAELHRREDPWPARARAIHEPGLVENVHGRVRGHPCGHEPAV
ncbi:hypothetical protein OIDMADRAFT_28313 [Oidiodendron maius Zn]|uniref:Uncharacterized protein n=1 Tax=Oidiodendron maius (strain Zn) TaxID=913774 RepID=A0A0C3DJQ9_OIDMZ|nr:hypothetical protein OIDMADRAFT_28313 [Oidiodendron maius Zn]